MKAMKKAVALLVMVLFGIGPAFAEVGQRWVQMVSDNEQHYAVDENGVLWGWNMVYQPDPVVLDASGGWTELKTVTSGDYLFAGIRDGDIYRGIGLTAPVQQTTSGDWSSVQITDAHSLGLKQDGTLWAWGENTRGQLGTGNTTASVEPVQVQPGQTFTTLSVANENSAAVRSDGTLWVTGQNAYGETGTGEPAGSDVLSWTQVAHPSGGTWATVSIGATKDSWGMYGYRMSVLALDSAGALYAWGGTDMGKAGLGDMLSDNLVAPVKVSDGPFVKVWSSPRTEASHALTEDGKLYGWGYTVNGEADYALVPTFIRDGVVDASIGSWYNALWTANGEVYHWTMVPIVGQNMTPDLLSATAPTLTASWSFIYPSGASTVASVFPDGSPLSMQPNHFYLQLNN